MTGRLKPIIDDARALYHKDKVIFALLILYCAIFAGFFFLPTDAHRDIFYLSLPLTLYVAFRNWAFLKQFYAAHKAAILLPAFYLGYLAISLFWSDTTEEGREFDKGKILLFLPLSMAGIFLTVKKAEIAYKWFVYAFVTGAVVSGLYLLPLHFIENYAALYMPRLEGLGRAENSVMAGYLYGMAFLAVTYAKSFAKVTWKYRIAIAVVMITVMLCSMSRGPLLAVAIAVGAMTLQKKQYRFFAGGVLAALVALVVIFSTGLREQIPIINRADTGRPQVWEQSVEQIAERPLFGYGVGSKFTYPYSVQGGRVEQASHPHSFYLGTLVQGGIVSLALLLGIMFLVARGSWRLCKDTGDGWPFAVFVSFATLGLYDFGGVYVNLGVVWVAFWFQHALIMAREKPDPVV